MPSARLKVPTVSVEPVTEPVAEPVPETPAPTAAPVIEEPEETPTEPETEIEDNTPNPAPESGKPEKPEKNMTLMDAAVAVLKEEAKPMNTREMVKAAIDKGYWIPTSCKTPEQTLYGSIFREMKTKELPPHRQKRCEGQIPNRLIRKQQAPVKQTGVCFSPFHNTPDGESQLDGIQHRTAVEIRPEIKRQPCDVSERPQIETGNVFFHIQHRSRQAYCRDEPSEGHNHENSPFLHISANRGVRSLNRSISSSVETVSL